MLLLGRLALIHMPSNVGGEQDQSNIMEAAVEHVLREYNERMERESHLYQELPREELDQRIDEFLLAVGRGVGQFLNLLVKELKPKCIVEIGGSYGYSTVWLAEAAKAVGAKVISLEIAEAKSAYAREKITQAGLSDSVEFMVGDARESISEINEPVGFVLMDLWKDLYVPCFELIHMKLAQDALVVADNMLFPENFREEVGRYQEAVRKTGDFETIVLPIGNGIALSRYVSSR